MTPHSAELELSIQHHAGDAYTVELRLSYAEEADAAMAYTGPLPLAHFPGHARDQLLGLSDNPDEYGKLLRDLLFADPDLRQQAHILMTMALAKADHMRMRLDLKPGATGPSPLHDLHWETLWHPTEDRPLASSEKECFSRSISSLEWSGMLRATHGSLDALIAVAAPLYPEPGMDKIDAPAELAVTRHYLEQLKGITIHELGANGPVSLADIVHGLQAKPGIFYLVAHGMRKLKGDPPGYYLALPRDRQPATHVEQLLQSLRGLGQLPRLIVLLSCYSAGGGQGSREVSAASNAALAALGPQLVMAGAPAVIAAQGPLSMTSARRFGEELFANLERYHGKVDQAVAAARAILRAEQRADWWAPVLFMRPRYSQIWQAEEVSYAYLERLRRWLINVVGMSQPKLKRIEEALLACPAASSISWDKVDSLEELVESIRTLHSGSPELARLDVVLAEELPRPISWAKTAELREHLRAVRLNPIELRDLFQACRPRDWELPTSRDEQTTLARTIYLLAGARRQPPGLGHSEPWLPLVELVRELLLGFAHKQEIANVAPALLRWAESITGQPLLAPPVLPLAPGGQPPPGGAPSPAATRRRRQRAFLILELIPAVGKEQPRPSPMFEGEVDLQKPETITFFPYAWLVREEAADVASGATRTIQTSLNIPSKNGSPVFNLVELRSSFAELVKSAEQLAQGDDLAVEVFLPFPLLTLDLDAWEAVRILGETRLLGRSYPFAVRALERVYGGDSVQLQKRWEDKWDQLQPLAATLHKHMCWFPGELDEDEELERYLEDDNYVALGLIQAQGAGPALATATTISPSRVLISAIVSGIPTALVFREGSDPALLRQTIEDELRAYNPSAPLPVEALKWRKQALRDIRRFGHCARLTLLWDDPNRRPPLPPFVQTSAE